MNILIAILAALLIGALVGLALMTAGVAFRVIMSPALRTPGGVGVRPQPRVADFLCLMALLQVSLLPLAALGPPGRHAGVLVYVAIAWTITGAIWWEGVKRLSDLRVTETRRRVAFLVVVGPLAYACAVFSAIGVLCAVTVFVGSLFNAFDEFPARLAWFFVWVAVAGLLLGSLLALGRCVSGWVVNAAPAFAVNAEAVGEPQPPTTSLQTPVGSE